MNGPDQIDTLRKRLEAAIKDGGKLRWRFILDSERVSVVRIFIYRAWLSTLASYLEPHQARAFEGMFTLPNVDSTAGSENLVHCLYGQINYLKTLLGLMSKN